MSNFTVIQEQVENTDHVVVLRINGLLDAQSEEQLLQAAQKAHAGGAVFLVIDMSQLHTLTSAGIRALQKTYKMFTPKESRESHLKLCTAQPQISNILSITGFLDKIPMYETLDAAVQSFNKE